MTPSKVRTARALLGMTQGELAKLAGVSQSYLCRYELTGMVSDRPWRSFDRVAAIRAALEGAGVDFEDHARLSLAPKTEPITPAQVRQARQLLGLTQQSLAVSARVALGYISLFERTGHVPAPKSGGPSRLTAIRATLEAAGVVFSDGDEPRVNLQRDDLSGGRARRTRA